MHISPQASMLVFYKVRFQETEFGETGKKLLLPKAVTEGLKITECECGIGGKNSPICYIPEQDPIQDMLEAKHLPTYFKLTLPKMGSVMRVDRWASGAPEHDLIHVQGVIHTIRQMGLKDKLMEANEAVDTANLDMGVTKATWKREPKKKEGEEPSNLVVVVGKAAQR